MALNLSQQPPEAQADILRKEFYKLIFPEFKCLNPEVIHEEILQENTMTGFFLIMKVPQGATCQALCLGQERNSDWRQLDDYVAFLIFIKNNHLVLMSVNNPFPSSLDDKIETLRQTVSKVWMSYRNESCTIDLNRIQGKFVQDRYYDPLNFFSIPVPSFQELFIQESAEPNKNKSSVLFVDVPLFVSQKVDVELFSSTDHLELFHDEPQAAAKILQSMFDECTLPDMVVQRPGTTLKHREVINPQSSEALLFAVLEMPSQEIHRGAPPLKLMGILFSSPTINWCS